MCVYVCVYACVCVHVSMNVCARYQVYSAMKKYFQISSIIAYFSHNMVSDPSTNNIRKSNIRQRETD